MTENEPMRLQKYLSQQGVCSRRAAEELIRQGAILINGQRATLGDKVTGDEIINVHGEPIDNQKQKTVVLAFHKPTGVQSTMRWFEDKETLANFDFGPQRVYPVGRLDADSRGLIIMTNDGELANRLMHPRYEHPKTYEVRLVDVIDDVALRQMEFGVDIEGKKTAPCVITRTSANSYEITLREGRNRQIRRMADAMGHIVLDLRRVRIANINLGELKRGRWRNLTDTEIAGLYKVVGL